MIQRFLQLFKHVAYVSRTMHVPHPILEADELHLLRDVVPVLEPLYEMTLEISSEKFTTISKVVPMVTNALKFFDRHAAGSSSAKELSENIVKGFRKRFNGFETRAYYVASTLLDPRFKHLYLSPSDIERASNTILQALGDPFEAATQVEENFNKTVWQYHDEILHPETDSRKELQRYLQLPVISRTDDPLEFWRQAVKSFPRLGPLAVKYLVPPATSVPSERLFSKAGALVSERRSRLDPSKLEAICFVGSLPRDELQDSRA